MQTKYSEENWSAWSIPFILCIILKPGFPPTLCRIVWEAYHLLPAMFYPWGHITQDTAGKVCNFLYWSHRQAVLVAFYSHLVFLTYYFSQAKVFEILSAFRHHWMENLIKFQSWLLGSSPPLQLVLLSEVILFYLQYSLHFVSAMGMFNSFIGPPTQH